MSLPDGPFIFVSYSSKDSYFVHPEIARLERQGYRVWYDKGRLRPGRLWADEIRQAVEACACFMVFLSEEAVNSENVCDEMDQALKAGKPFICVYWEKVELPPRFRETIRSIQALERYSLRRHEYEAPLEAALREHIKKIALTPSPPARPDALPIIVYFALLLSAGAFLLFSFVAALTPYFSSPLPGDPLNSRLAGVLTSLFFAAVAFSLSAGAFVVHRLYLRRKDG